MGWQRKINQSEYRSVSGKTESEMSGKQVIAVMKKSDMIDLGYTWHEAYV